MSQVECGHLGVFSSSSSSSTNSIATASLETKTSGPLCVTYYTTAVMSMLLWPIVCIAVWSAEQFRFQCALECPQRRQSSCVGFKGVWFTSAFPSIQTTCPDHERCDFIVMLNKSMVSVLTVTFAATRYLHYFAATKLYCLVTEAWVWTTCPETLLDSETAWCQTSQSLGHKLHILARTCSIASAVSSDFLCLHSILSLQRLRSAIRHQLIVPMVWNLLPDHLHDPLLSIGSFRSALKTFLFAMHRDT